MSDNLNVQQLREQVEAAKLRVEAAHLQKQLDLMESTSIYGEPVDFAKLDLYRGMPLMPVWGANTRPERPHTILTISQLDLARNRSRHLAQTNGNAKAILVGLQAYTVGKGVKTKVASNDEDAEPPKMLARKVTRLIKDFNRENRIDELAREWVERDVRDGESFLRIYPDEDNLTKIRYREPDEVRPPSGESADGPWSWGVYTPDRDVMRPKAFNFHDWLDNADEEVEAQFVIHSKNCADSNKKRGLPEFYSCDDELRGAAKLRYANREGEKIRASLAYLRQWSGPMSGPRTLQQASVTDTIEATDQFGQTREIQVQEVEPGAVHDIPKGMQMVDPPKSPNSAAAATAVQQSLEAAGAATMVPSWLVTGNHDVSSFAASFTTEAPFSKSLELRQSRLTAMLSELYRRVIEIAIEQQVLPEDTLDEVEVQVMLPCPEVRNVKEENEVYERQHQAGARSLTSWQIAADLDPERENANFLSERQRAQEVGQISGTGGPSYASG